jgi:hypothetical protein
MSHKPRTGRRRDVMSHYTLSPAEVRWESMADHVIGAFNRRTAKLPPAEVVAVARRVAGMLTALEADVLGKEAA